MKRRPPVTPPKCHCAPCLEPAMQNCPDCAYHWRNLRGWDEANACYPDDVQPFEQGDEDTQHWDATIEAVKQA